MLDDISELSCSCERISFFLCRWLQAHFLVVAQFSVGYVRSLYAELVGKQTTLKELVLIYTLKRMYTDLFERHRRLMPSTDSHSLS